MKGRLQEKNGYWYVVIARGQGQNPKWVATGLKITGNKREASRLIAPIVADYEAQCKTAAKQPSAGNGAENGVVTGQEIMAPDGPLFTDIIKIYLSVAKVNVKVNTYEKYLYAAEKHIIPYFKGANMRLSELDTLTLQEYFHGKIDAGLSKESMKYHKTVINQTLKYAIEPLKLIQNNPAAGIQLGKSADTIIRFYDADRLKELLDRITGEGRQISAPVILAAYYGLRREEVLGLQWPAIDFKNKTIVICRTAIKTQSGTVYANTVKSKSSYRTMPLFPEIEAYLRNLYDYQKQMQAVFKKSYIKNDEVCKWDDGHLVSPDYVSQRFGKLIKKYDLPKLTFHQLRHSTASLLINEGYSLKEIQEWLGHANPRSTDVYTHLLYKSKVNMANTIGHSLQVPKSSQQSEILNA
ncbi:site-specific integrase [Clostridia bacterium]|nr:site-specific integrase [Clostridia bacterium]